MIHSAQKKPAVLILGWLGAKEKHMSKIGSFYNGLNVDIISAIQSPTSLLNIRRDKFIDEIYEKVAGRPIVCHVFSLNGASTFYKSLTTEDLILKPKLDIKGMIYDCTPGHINRSLYHRAFSSAIFPKSQKLRKVASIALMPVFDLFLLFARSHTKESNKQLKALYDNPFKFPSLSIASKKDDLISYEDVFEYADKVKALGEPVIKCLFDKTTHVSAFNDYPEFYGEMVSEFANNCLFNHQSIVSKDIIH